MHSRVKDVGPNDFWKGSEGGIAVNERPNELRARLEEAVDGQDTVEIERALDALCASEPMNLAAEDPKAFSARILKLQEERNRAMKNPGRTGRTILVAAAVAAALSVGVYAAANWQRFAFVDGDQMVVVAGEDLTEQEAQRLSKEPPQVHIERNKAAQAAPEVDGMAVGDGKLEISFVEDPDAPKDAELSFTQKETQEYESPEAAAKALGLPVALPEIPAGLTLESVSGQQNEDYGKTVWVDYDGDGKHLGVTVDWTRRKEDRTVVAYHGIEPGSGGSYQTAKGYAFTTVREDGADIATIYRGAYEYTLVFEGFSEAERQAALDSLDLAAY